MYNYQKESLLTLNSECKTKYITNDFIGSPELKNRYGSMRDVLKVVATEGFNINSISKISSDPEYDLSYIEVPVNHGYFFNQVINISGSTNDLINKDYRILEASKTQLIVRSGGLDLTTEESSLKIKIAPLGFTLVFENIAEGIIILKNTSTTSPGFLKIIDKIPPNGYLTNWAKYARVVMGNKITTEGEFVDNIKVPYHSDFPDVEKSGNNVSGASGIHGYAKWEYDIMPSAWNTQENHNIPQGLITKNWKIVGDDNTFYFMVNSADNSRYCSFTGFGNYISDNPSADSSNICLQAKEGFEKASTYDSHNYTRSRNDFGVLDGKYGGFIFASIYGKPNLDYNKNLYRCAAAMLTNTELNRPWKATDIKNYNPASGRKVASEILLKDSDNYIRGRHRGVRILYGSSSDFAEGALSKEGDLILYVQSAESSSSYSVMPLLFTLKDWEQV